MHARFVYTSTSYISYSGGAGAKRTPSLYDPPARSTAGDESRCFSLLTAKTTLDLEASCEVDRNCLVHGFRHLIKQHNSANSSGEDAFL